MDMKKILGIMIMIMCFASSGFALTYQWTMTTISPTGSASIACPFNSGELYVYTDAAIDLTIRGATQPLAIGDAIDFEDALFYQDESVSISGTANVTYQWRQVN